MKRRELAARIVLLATILLLAQAVSGAPVENGFRLINKGCNPKYFAFCYSQKVCIE